MVSDRPGTSFGNALQLHPQDNVALARVDLDDGAALVLDSPGAAPVFLRQPVPAGHKVALETIAAGEPVIRFGELIGVATQAVLTGEHVHSHNLGLTESARAHPFGAPVQPTEPAPEAERRSFLGYRRANGRVGTRNYVAILSTVNCSAHVCREIGRHFTPERLAPFHNVSGVAVFAHSLGCTGGTSSRDQAQLQRTLAGFARHPNVGACLLVGLGCETNQAGELTRRYELCEPAGPPTLVIQDMGGIRKTVEAGITAVEALLPSAGAIQRTLEPLSELMLAVQCGGSDSWSGVTANPVVGLVADQVVRQGGTVVLAETPEIYGAEHLLTRRAVSAEIAQKLLDQLAGWEGWARAMGYELDQNRSVGNAAGGLTTIYEKALGAVAKSGHMPVTGVYDYAEPVTQRGVAFMNTPGYDPVSVTGQVAGGCNLVLFTTGRGSVLGFRPTPVIKISSHTSLFQRMSDDIDLDAGRVLDGLSLEEAAMELLGLATSVASGQPSKSEAQGVGEAEFAPWSLGGPL